MSAFVAAHWIFLSLLFVTILSAMWGAVLFDALLKYECKFCRDSGKQMGACQATFGLCPMRQT